jgi:uncharacterized membrane protein/nitrite reductase/ring-hydroxylating ferredoxin subunit
MRSRASVKGHPIHPALIPFPFAFLYGAVIFDVLGLLADHPGWRATGGYLAVAGILAALIAAVPGFIDYLYTVPPNSSGKARATRHMTVNLGAVALFTIAVWLRVALPETPVPSLALELIGAALLTAGGWMGGVLVSRNQISVDHRYAGAGKWREARLAAPAAGSLVVAGTDELEVNQMKLLRVGDRRIVLARTENDWVAFDDHCTHRGGSLAGGVMMCSTVQCPWHGSQFDVSTGAVRAGPAEQPISTYRLEERNGEILLMMPAKRA